MESVESKVVKEIIANVEPSNSNGFELRFDEIGFGFTMRSLGYIKTLMFKFGNASYDAESFSFYKNGEVVYKMNRRWFGKNEFEGNYEVAKFGKHEKIKRVKKENLDDALNNQEKYGLFFVSEGRGLGGGNKASVYVPLEYLENLGYRVERATTTSRLETNITEIMYAGSKENDNAINFFLSSKTTKHIENYKDLMIEQLQRGESVEDLKRFIDDWKYKIEYLD